MNYTEKNKFIDSLCGIGLMLLLTEMFYWIVNDAFTVYNHNLDNVTKVVQISGAVFLLIAIIVLVRAYKKSDLSLALYGLEFLALSILAALLPGAYMYFSYPFNLLAKGFPFIFLLYYIIKLIAVFIKTFKKKGKK